MSVLTYNGITIGLTKTLGIAHEPQRAEDGTYLHTKITIEVEGIITGPISQSQNPVTLGNVSGTIDAGSISDTVRAIRHALLQERQLLVYDVGDSPTPMITAPGLDGTGNFLPCDANNGPIPGALAIVRVDGLTTFHVRYSVTCHLFECPGASGTPQALISNRYAQSHSIDSQYFTVITTTGQAFFNTSVLEAAQQQADDFRQVLFPPVPRGFKRLSVNIIATPARNALTYQVVDQERYFDLGDTGRTGTGSYITDIKADYTVSSTGQAGAPVSMFSAHQVNVQVVGSKAASTWGMIKKALLIAQAKLPITDPSKGFLTSMVIRQGMTEPTISLSASMLINPSNAGMVPGIDATALQIENVFQDQGGINPSFPSRGGTAGTYQNELLVSAWKAACSPPTKPYEGSVASANSDSSVSDNTGPVVTIGTSADLPTIRTKFSTSQAQNLYTDYKVDTKIVTDTGIMQVANSGAVSSNSSAGVYSSGSGSSSGSDSDSVFLTYSRPTQRKIVEWTAERSGAMPDVPNAQPVDSNLVLIDSGHIQVCEPSLLTDGFTLSYRVAGRYVYGMKKNLSPTADLVFPAVPWQSDYYGDNTLTATNFLDGIIDGGTQSQGSA